MAEGEHFYSKTIKDSITNFEENDMSESDSLVTASTNSTTLHRRNSSLRLTVENLKSTFNLLNDTATKYVENHIAMLEKQTNLETLQTKSQLRNSEDVLRDSVVFLTGKVKSMRETMIEHRDKTGQLLNQLELIVNSDVGDQDETENQDETKKQEQQTFSLSEMETQSSNAAAFPTFCGPCSFENKEVLAIYFCEDCDEPYCKDCRQFHQADNSNFWHKLKTISKDALNCSTCKQLKKYTKASCYCLDCRNTPVFCDNCSQKHISMRKNRSHNISRDLDLLLARRSNEMSISTKMIGEKFSLLYTRNPARIMGQPYSLETKTNSIVLQWQENGYLEVDEIYEIRYKTLHDSVSSVWKLYNDETCIHPYINIHSLTPNTTYVFKVRITNKKTGQEFPFTEESEQITTLKSLTKDILKTASMTKDGHPKVYTLPIEENLSARNEEGRTRKFVFGKESPDTVEKTVLIVGGTGCGKSTLVNGLVNYVIGVEWEDPFRFDLVDLEENCTDQSVSQTTWITCYTLHGCVSNRINYTVNLIDTPGFGDTRGIDHDNKIIDQIRQLFTATGEKGMSILNAVCLILRAPDARLTISQSYIVESILSLFGKDIKNNFCTVITFTDGQTPLVLSAIKAIRNLPLPVDIYFPFNNSALYADNVPTKTVNMSFFFWEKSMISYQSLLSHIYNMKPVSIVLSAEVLTTRAKLELNITHLNQEIDVGLSKLTRLETEFKLFSENSRKIQTKNNYTYEIVEVFPKKINTSQQNINCETCKFTCHQNCTHSEEYMKQCIAMNKEGTCTECPKGCPWSDHTTGSHIYEFSKTKVKKNYEDIKNKYEEAAQKPLVHEQVLEEIRNDIFNYEKGLEKILIGITELHNRLQEIALQTKPLSTSQYIDVMIRNEQKEKRTGFEDRMNALKKRKHYMHYNDSVQSFKERVKRLNTQLRTGESADELLKGDSYELRKIRQNWRDT